MTNITMNTENVIVREPYRDLERDKDREVDCTWHNSFVGAFSCFTTYAEGNHPAFPLHSPSDHPLGHT